MHGPLLVCSKNLVERFILLQCFDVSNQASLAGCLIGTGFLSASVGLTESEWLKLSPNYSS